MHNFTLHFTYPWLLLLLIPAAALTVFLYLRQNKRYRRNRNRITSIVLHSVVMLLCILTLSGLTFRYSVSNKQNELVLLVDVSDTLEEETDRRDDFVQSVLQEGEYEGFRMAVVTFGFDQRLASPFTYNSARAFDDYLTAELPDTSATDIAAALTYARSIMEHPETGKIVLISDGRQTDEQATSVIRAVASQGVTVDTVHIAGGYNEELIQVRDVVMPEYNVRIGESCTIEVILESTQAVSDVSIELFDNGTVDETGSMVTNVANGQQTFRFEHVFHEDGLHELHVRLNVQDAREENNEFYAYRWLQTFNQVLILEQADQSEELVKMLETDEIGYEIDVINLNDDANAVPASVDALRKYDQVILNNISSRDLEKYGLDALLYDYVYTYGGGLFTTGGTEADGETAHAYNRQDMNNTLYQQMLPVQAVDYVPPVGVFIVIDTSGSMTSSSGGMTNLEWAKQGALACLDALTERDYIGVMTMASDYGMWLDLTQRTQDAYIRQRILDLDGTGGTVFSTAIDRAAQRLANLDTVDKRHIVLVTDGMPSADDIEKYESNAQNAYDRFGITISVVGVGIGTSGSSYENMRRLVGIGHGRLHVVAEGGQQLMQEMREDLNAPEIKDVNYTDFKPRVLDSLSPLLHGVVFNTAEEQNVVQATLGGFFGVKRRQLAETVLVGDYEVPIYAQWKFGQGMVGSFMCDVYSDWSSDFISNDNGRQFLLNAVANLMPMNNIRPSSMHVDLNEDNYINRMSIYTTLEDGQTIDAAVYAQGDDQGVSLNRVSGTQSGDLYVVQALGSGNSYSRAQFVLKKGGVYNIVINKRAADGSIIDTLTISKSFAYSEEYDLAMEEDTTGTFMAELAEKGGGKVVAEDEPWEVFSTFITEIGREFDPRILFMILAMILFLLDIAVRKFKFKWPHEIIRDYKQKKAQKKEEEEA